MAISVSAGSSNSNSSNQPTLAYQEIDPEQALALLDKNAHNRNWRPRVTEQYARDMLAGNWLPTGEPIIIALDGTLLNGQHRLRAVVEANMTIVFPVIRNAGPEYQRVADAGFKRSFADVLHLEFNETNTRLLAGAVRQVALYRAAGCLGALSGSDPDLTQNELVGVYLRESGLRDSIPYSTLLTTAALAHKPAISTALHYLFSEVDPSDAGPYFRTLASGEMLPKDDPCFVLRRRLEKAAVSPRDRLLPTYFAAFMIKTFNYWRQGRSITTVTWHPGGSRKEEFPRILTADEIG
jgi:hypothetical protein